jgi:peroxidase
MTNKRRLLHSFFQSNGPWFPVETGRRDGRVSFEYDANNDVPGPNNTIVDLKIYFSFKGLGWKDIVVLSGNSFTISNELCLF